MIDIFRELIFQVPKNVISAQPSNQIFTAFQNLFREMEMGKKAVSTTDFTNVWMHETGDLADFMNALLTKLSETLKGTKYENKIIEIFGGTFAIGHQGEPFLSLPCEVQGIGNLEDCFKAQFAGQEMEGFSVQPGLKFRKYRTVSKFPRILLIHLKRSNSLQEKPNNPTISPYLDFANLVQAKSPLYHLQGRIMHDESRFDGHYADIKDSTGRWLRFNDDTVSVLDEKSDFGITDFVVYSSKQPNMDEESKYQIRQEQKKNQEDRLTKMFTDLINEFHDQKSSYIEENQELLKKIKIH